MRRSVRLIPLMLLGACATGGTTAQTDDASVRPAVIMANSPGGSIMSDAPATTAAALSAPPEAVWTAVKAVYASWEIPVTIDNPAAHQLGNREFIKSRRLAGQPMAQLVDCGNGMTGPKAVSFRIFGSLMTRVDGDGKGGTNLRATFTAQGQDIEGGASDRIVCGTNGRLEQALIENVRQRLNLH